MIARPSEGIETIEIVEGGREVVFPVEVISQVKAGDGGEVGDLARVGYADEGHLVSVWRSAISPPMMFQRL